MGLIELPILLGLGVAIAVFISRSNQRKRLESAFCQLLRQQDSCISLIQLMAISQVSSQTTKVFLDEQVRLLDGIPEVEDNGDTFYRFPKLRLPSLLADDGWWQSTGKLMKQHFPARDILPSAERADTTTHILHLTGDC